MKKITFTAQKMYHLIGEVSLILNEPEYTLRYWETQIPVIQPKRRGDGRRVYQVGDIAILKKVKRLLRDDGYTILGARKVLMGGLDEVR